MNKNNDRFLDLQEAAGFLKCREEELSQKVREKKIPHSTPFGKPIFDPQRLIDWVHKYEQMPEYKKQGISADATGGISLTEEICRRFGYVTRASKRYINFCVGQIVFAELHPRYAEDGVDLALRECGNDNNLPECSVLKRINIRELAGFWRTNKSWLEGVRFTNCPAAAFHISNLLLEEKQSDGWKELQALLEYTKDKLEKQLRKKTC